MSVESGDLKGAHIVYIATYFVKQTIRTGGQQDWNKVMVSVELSVDAAEVQTTDKQDGEMFFFLFCLSNYIILHLSILGLHIHILDRKENRLIHFIFCQ